MPVETSASSIPSEDYSCKLNYSRPDAHALHLCGNQRSKDKREQRQEKLTMDGLEYSKKDGSQKDDAQGDAVRGCEWTS